MQILTAKGSCTRDRFLVGTICRYCVLAFHVTRMGMLLYYGNEFKVLVRRVAYVLEQVLVMGVW